MEIFRTFTGIFLEILWSFNGIFTAFFGVSSAFLRHFYGIFWNFNGIFTAFFWIEYTFSILSVHFQLAFYWF